MKTTLSSPPTNVASIEMSQFFSGEAASAPPTTKRKSFLRFPSLLFSTSEKDKEEDSSNNQQADSFSQSFSPPQSPTTKLALRRKTIPLEDFFQPQNAAGENEEVANPIHWATGEEEHHSAKIAIPASLFSNKKTQH